MDYLQMKELYHHGIKGQKWGDKNGPPYPLDYDDHSAAERKENPKGKLNNYASMNRKERKQMYKSFVKDRKTVEDNVSKLERADREKLKAARKEKTITRSQYKKASRELSIKGEAFTSALSSVYLSRKYGTDNYNALVKRHNTAFGRRFVLANVAAIGAAFVGAAVYRKINN